MSDHRCNICFLPITSRTVDCPVCQYNIIEIDPNQKNTIYRTNSLSYSLITGQVSEAVRRYPINNLLMDRIAELHRRRDVSYSDINRPHILFTNTISPEYLEK